MKATQLTMKRYWTKAFLSIVFASCAGAQVFGRQDNGVESAKLVPADADVYSVVLRIPEQWNRFASGPVVAKFLELPSVDNAIELFRSEWTDREGFGATARTALENPNTKDGLAFARELISGELFMLGDKNVSQWYEAQAKLNDDMRELAIKSELSEVDRAVGMMTKTIKILEKLTVPIVLVGAKCNDVDLALGKIDQLEAVIQLGMSSIPNGSLIFKNFGRIDDARGDRLQLRFDGTQIPWDEFPVSDIFGDEVIEQFREVVEKKSITITVGMYDGFFVVGVSPSSKALLELGKSKSILDIPEMQVVKEASTKPLTYIGYTSDALSKATFEANLNNFFSRNIVTLLGPVMTLVGQDSPIRDYSKNIMEDCKWVDESIAKLVPEFKGSTSLSYLTDDGWERHDYSRTRDVLAESISPLSALEHMGTDPMLFVATRLQSRPEFFQLSRKIVQKIKAQVDQGYEMDWSDVGGAFSFADMLGPYLSWFFPDQDWDSNLEAENVKSYMDMGWPFLVRLADTWEKKFLPAMSGEHAIVVAGGNLAAKQWFQDMPPSVDPLGLPEFASLCGIKDRATLNSAFEDLFQTCNDLVDAIRTKYPSSIPAGYKIPRPTKSQSKVGETFGYAIPTDFPFPKGMMPQAMFAGNWMIEGYSSKQTESIAETRQLEKGKGIIDPLTNHSSASYVNVGKIFEFARPWIRYALSEGMESMEDPLFEDTLPQNYELTGKDLLSAWSVLNKIGEFASVTVTSPTGGSHIRSVYKSQK